MYQYYLQRAGFRVTTAADGEEALAKVASWHPDLILMDLSMPGMSGWEVTRVLKQDRDTAAIPVVVLTAHDTPTERARSVAEGCSGFVAKPCTPRELAREVAQALAPLPPRE